MYVFENAPQKACFEIFVPVFYPEKFAGHDADWDTIRVELLLTNSFLSKSWTRDARADSVNIFPNINSVYFYALGFHVWI